MESIGWLSGTLDAEGNVENALDMNQLNSEVQLHPINTRIYEGGKEIRRKIEDSKAVVRMSDYKPIAVVGKDYQPVQDVEAFGVLDTLVNEGRLVIEKVQSVGDGKKTMIVSRAPEPIDIAGEPFNRYQAWLNGHDGKTPVVMVSMPTRIFCTNVLRGSLSNRNDGSYKIKHTRRALIRLAEKLEENFGIRSEEKQLEMLNAEFRSVRESVERRENQDLKADATNAMEREARYVMELQEIGNDLAGRKMSPNQFEKFLANLVPITPEMHEVGVTRREDKRADIRSIWVSADDLGNVRDTYWGALQSVIMWNDHYKNYRSVDSKLMSIIGGGQDVKNALALLRN